MAAKRFYETQIEWCQETLRTAGADALRRHAAVGAICLCGDCFCCAARKVLREHLGKKVAVTS